MPILESWKPTHHLLLYRSATKPYEDRGKRPEKTKERNTRFFCCPLLFFVQTGNIFIIIAPQLRYRRRSHSSLHQNTLRLSQPTFYNTHIEKVLCRAAVLELKCSSSLSGMMKASRRWILLISLSLLLSPQPNAISLFLPWDIMGVCEAHPCMTQPVPHQKSKQTAFFGNEKTAWPLLEAPFKGGTPAVSLLL